MVNAHAHQRLAMALLTLALAGCQSPASATLLPPTATVTAVPVASPTSIPVSPTATPTPPPTASPVPVMPPTATLIPPGELTRSLLIETSANPSMDCYPEIDQHALWLAEPSYTDWKPFAPSEADSRRQPVWSPTGARVAFVSESETITRLGVTNAAGENSTWLGPDFAVGRMESLCNHLTLGRWSPSENWLAFDYSSYTGQFYRELYLVDTATGAAQMVAEDFFGFPSPTWSPTDDRFVYVGGTYNVKSHHLDQMSLKLVTANAAEVSVIALGAPTDFDSKHAQDMVRSLVWQTDSAVLVSVWPGFEGLPDRLYRVNVDAETWELLARSPREGNYRPGTLALSPDGRWLAWANEDLFVLDTATWKIAARLPTSWQYFVSVDWVIDSNGRQILIYSNANALWQYAPDNGANELLIAEPSFIVDQHLFLAGAAWSP